MPDPDHPLSRVFSNFLKEAESLRKAEARRINKALAPQIKSQIQAHCRQLLKVMRNYGGKGKGPEYLSDAVKAAWSKLMFINMGLERVMIQEWYTNVYHPRARSLEVYCTSPELAAVALAMQKGTFKLKKLDLTVLYDDCQEHRPFVKACLQNVLESISSQDSLESLVINLPDVDNAIPDLSQAIHNGLSQACKRCIALRELHIVRSKEPYLDRLRQENAALLSSLDYQKLFRSTHDKVKATILLACKKRNGTKLHQMAEMPNDLWSVIFEKALPSKLTVTMCA